MIKKNKFPIGLASVSFILLTLSLFFYLDYKNSITRPVSDSSELINFSIEEGQSTKDIAANLLDAELITSSIYFEIYVRQNNLAANLQAGSFQIPGNVTMEELSEILQIAYEQDVWVIIPEGLTKIEIADLLADGFSDVENPSFIRNEFITLTETTDPVQNAGLTIPAGKNCEGYLFPDTYRFSPDSTAQSVLETLISNFKIKIYDEYYKEIESSGYSLYEVLILASIIERETKNSDDRPLAADILERRLNDGWALEVDATLLYHFQDWEYDISSEDLKIDTPYNTRIYQGLTPTPICNPGEESIDAVLNPQSNDYWFYVSDEEGDLHYGKTIDEHNQNIQQYLSP